jgi:choline dehydrogenase-like flavoprotein
VAPRVAVIGSGPAGIACAKALLRRGATVELIDVGERLSPEAAALKQRLASLPPERWQKADVAAASDNPTMSGKGFPQKYLFGSDRLTRGQHIGAPVTAGWPIIAQSFAAGGLSIAWGAALLPITATDIAGWPIGRHELDPAYERVLADLPLAARDDGLSAEFPLYGKPERPLPLPAALSNLLEDIARARGLTGEIRFGQARLAVHIDSHQDGVGCQRCGLCLSGCPYGAIHTMAAALDGLRRRNAIRYRTGLMALEVAEDASGPILRLRDVTSGERSDERFDAIFVAAGAFGSLRIALASLQAYGDRVRVLDSQKFILPLMRWRASPLDWPRALTLPGVFVDFKVRDLSEHWIHAQVSAMNGYLLERLCCGPDSAGWRQALLRPLVERLLVAWCGLHSDHSSTIDVSLTLSAASEPGTLALTANANPAGLTAIRSAARQLARLGRQFGIVVATPMLKSAPVGGGNHLGGCLPMRRQPVGRWDTDTLGRLQSWRRVHFVDGAVLPSIPATTLALTIMANADRIATTAPLSPG